MIRAFLVRLVLNAVGLVVAARVVPGVELDVGRLETVALVALIFGLVNAFIRPLALLVTCLINWLTLGLFTLVINALMFWLTAEVARALGLGFAVRDFWAAFLGALVVSAVSLVLSWAFRGLESG